ncbi:Peptidase family M50 [Roseimaritima multifibrata]|uniref:Peptidase family M50 n=1 Tax=Roseimaritima multifibrata TaxID=1930274 RepID=A0A517MNW9_9BACT|nr:site-2 protease family protein [Roseimaritima multifibrata]QDS96575.1 Peptidase family M50 [Roseimaritima multifibrata]
MTNADSDSDPKTASTQGPLPGPAALARLHPALHFRKQTTGGQISYVCHDPRRSKYFHFGAIEYEVAIQLDGKKSPHQISANLQDSGIDWTDEEVVNLIASLVRSQLAEVTTEPSSPAAKVVAASEGSSSKGMPAPSTAEKRPRSVQAIGILSLLVSQRIPLFVADPLATRLTRSLHGLFSVWGVLAWSLLIGSGAWCALSNRNEFRGELGQLFSTDAWPLLIVIWVVAKAIHEMGHALAAKRQGVTIGKAGIMFFMLAPLAYVDVTNAWQLRRRWARVQIALAGVYCELAIAAIAIWVWHYSSDVMLRHIAVQVVMITGPATLFVNANPLLRLDGYYALADILQIPNLRMHGRRHLSGLCQQWLLGRPMEPSLLTGWRRPTALLHAFASVLFQIVWMGGLLWGISQWGGILGMLMGIAAFALWVAIPLWRWTVSLHRLPAWPAYRFRLGLLAVIVCVGVGLVATFPSPLGRRIPVVVRYADEQLGRAASDSFIEMVAVSTGQCVQQDQILVRLSDPELQTRHDEIVLEIEATKIKKRILTNQGKQGLATAEEEHLLALDSERSELKRQLESLTLRATRPGIVISADLAKRQGTFVQQGEIVVRVADESTKELLAAIDETDLQAYRAAARIQHPLPVRFRGGQKTEVIPGAPRPRGGLAVPHVALIAGNGGPLATAPLQESRQADEPSNDSLQLATPHTESISRLSAAESARLRAGQQGMLTIGDSRSLVERLFSHLALSYRPFATN